MLTPVDKHGLIIHLNDKVDLEESVDDPNPGGPSSGSGGPSSGSVGPVPVGHTTPAATPKKSGKGAVEHKYLHNYGPERLWIVICDKTVTLETKLSATMSNPEAEHQATEICYPGIMLCEVNQILMQKFGTTLLTGLQMQSVDMQKEVLLLRSQNIDAVGSSEARDAA